MLYRSVPEYRERIWGSIDYSGRQVGEIYWIFHDSDDHSTVLISQNGNKTSITELIHKKELHGKHKYPILVKTLYTADKLSVQVHPGKNGGILFKEETWIVLKATSNSQIFGGLLDGMDEKRFRQALEDESAGSVLRKETVRTGDIRHIPPGTVHSLGPGLEILEIQTNCDVTYRLFDWNRRDSDNNTRELHIEKGLDAVRWTDNAGFRDAGSNGIVDEGVLADCRYSIRNTGTSREYSTIPPNGVFFLTEGTCRMGEIQAEAPACFLADADGGEIYFDGYGFIVTEKEK